MKIMYYMGLLLSYNYILLCIYLTNPTNSDVFVHIFVRLGNHDGSTFKPQHRNWY